MKVCFATDDSPTNISGVSSWLQRLLPLLTIAKIELEVHVIAVGGKPGVECTYLKKQDIPVRWIPNLTHLPSAVRWRLQCLEESQPDIYVPNSSFSAYYAAGYARRGGIPTVGVLHSDDPCYWGIVDEFVNGDPEFRVSAIVPVSKFLESQIAEAAKLGIAVQRIGYGVPIPKKTAELSRSEFRLVYVGRLVEEQKRISDVANSLCTAVENIPNLEAWLVGEGPARPAVERIIRERRTGSRVHLVGRIDNAHIYEVLAHCHGLVLLSDYEGLPVSVLEAMAAGVVPICLDTRSGIREVIEHGVNGLIVKDRAGDFLAAVRGLQNDPANWQRLSLAARETVRQRYSIEACARQWVELLEDLYQGRATRGHFQAPRVLRLPPPDPRFWIPGMTSPAWKRILGRYIQFVPTLFKIAKASVAVAQRVKSEATIRLQSRRRF